MKRIILLALVLVNVLILFAQSEDTEYIKVLTERSDKIAKTLNIEDQTAYNRVVNAIVGQYKNVGLINDEAESAKKLAKTIADQAEREQKMLAIENERNAKLYQQSCIFVGDLSQDLNNDEIVTVKDGLTYGVVKVTYDSYLDMIPSLKDTEKKQIYGWLVEAREHAIGASSSKDKHGWFGKYKGRINNYLSAQGYDIQQERKGWEERLKAQGKSL